VSWCSETRRPAAGLPRSKRSCRIHRGRGEKRALRRHHSQIIENATRKPEPGRHRTIIVRGKAPMAQSTDTTMYALEEAPPHDTGLF